LTSFYDPRISFQNFRLKPHISCYLKILFKIINKRPRRSALPERERIDFVAFFFAQIKNGKIASFIRKANRHLHEGDFWLFKINLKKQIDMRFYGSLGGVI